MTKDLRQQYPKREEIPMRQRRLTGVLLTTVLSALLVTTAASTNAMAAKFEYALYEAIKPDATGLCPVSSNDVDGDCLSDSMENALATIVAPYYFWDEGDNCNYFADQNAYEELHFKPRWFHQVRPVGSSVSGWRNNSTVKTLKITYFFNYPEDCAGIFEGGGHLGDNERVVFTMKSTDLVHWTVDEGNYFYHSFNRIKSGDFIYSIATSVNGYYPIVLAGDDSHGSYWGDHANSELCCGDAGAGVNECEDDYCLQGTLATSMANGTWAFPLSSLNIGGPSPENWNFAVLGNDNGVPYSAPDVGHGFAPDYWSAHPQHPAWSARFCGFSCITVNSSGDCTYEPHTNSECTTNLQAKLDTTSFSR